MLRTLQRGARVALGLLVMATGCVIAQEPAGLQWSWSKGSVMRYRITEIKRQQNSGTGGMSLSETSQTVWHYEVKDVSDQGVATIEAKVVVVIENCLHNHRIALSN